MLHNTGTFANTENEVINQGTTRNMSQIIPGNLPVEISQIKQENHNNAISNGTNSMYERNYNNTPTVPQMANFASHSLSQFINQPSTSQNVNSIMFNKLTENLRFNNETVSEQSLRDVDKFNFLQTFQETYSQLAQRRYFQVEVEKLKGNSIEKSRKRKYSQPEEINTETSHSSSASQNENYTDDPKNTDQANPSVKTTIKVEISETLLENSDENNTEENDVKIDIASETDVYTEKDKTIFLQDINGVLRDDVCKAGCLTDSLNEAVNSMTIGEKSTDPWYECTKCHIHFNNPKRFLIHHKWHSFGLTHAKRKFLLKAKEIKKMRAKMMVKEGDENGIYPCSDCDLTFNKKSGLHHHRVRCHTKDKFCKVCQAPVKSYRALHEHIETVHFTGKGYKCPVCSRMFKLSPTLSKHAQTHWEKTHKCPECPKSFGSKQLLAVHKKSHERARSEPSYHCFYCAKSFHESYPLQVHERTHRNEKPYKCEICHTGYSTNSSLKRHMNVSHTSNKPFECKTCHRHFGSQLGLDRHLVVDHMEKAPNKYDCKECNEKFPKRKELVQHGFKVHPKKTRTSENRRVLVEQKT